jgi:polar amino acid transport system substrate-binding protein
MTHQGLRRRAAPLVVALVPLLHGPLAQAREAPVRLVTEALPPFSYEEGGVVKGASTDIVRAVMDAAGLRYSIEVLPWRRALDAALNEKDTFIYSVARTSGREGQLVWVGKICDRVLAVYCLKERKDLLAHPLAELRGATFAVVQGDASEEVLRSLGFGDGNLHFVRDAAAPLASSHVLAGRSDFFVSNPYRFQYQMKGSELRGRFRLHSTIPGGEGYYLAANRSSDPALVARVHEAFATLAARGVLRRILAASLPPLAGP